MTITPHLKYLRYLLRHKWFVFLAGLTTKVPFWRLVIHDWSKFLPCEWFPYVEKFYGSWRSRAEKNPSDFLIHLRFDYAWLHHQHSNLHHWQHWILRNDDGSEEVMEMPENFVREMVADWMGAGRAITGKWEAAEWYLRNNAAIKLHSYSRLRAEELLGIKQKAATSEDHLQGYMKSGIHHADRPHTVDPYEPYPVISPVKEER